jgi:tRNA threonylcarbamoyladenosine biosynthesis protein TsaE|tara:strand:- start:681 stop:1136 length:456 start_codon:yes stop_codon:yes gene_type:complete
MIIKSLEQLEILSIKIAKKISNSDCILLYGEIGSGKTTFSRYLINFIQEKNNIKKTEVLSPTFNLLYEYKINSLKVMHYDLYRLKKSAEIKQLDIFDVRAKTVKIIEWPELITHNIIDKIELRFSHMQNMNERNLSFKGYGKWKDFQIDEF